MPIRDGNPRVEGNASTLHPTTQTGSGTGYADAHAANDPDPWRGSSKFPSTSDNGISQQVSSLEPLNQG